jgi:hypothetical protein
VTIQRGITRLLLAGLLLLDPIAGAAIDLSVAHRFINPLQACEAFREQALTAALAFEISSLDPFARVR